MKVLPRLPLPASCHACGAEPLWVADIRKVGNYYAVVCKCGVHGPAGLNRIEAAQKWNALQTHLRELAAKGL